MDPRFQPPEGASLEEQIQAKRDHIAHHEVVLQKYVGNRWFNQSKTYGEQLRAELAELEAQLQRRGGPGP